MESDGAQGAQSAESPPSQQVRKRTGGKPKPGNGDPRVRAILLDAAERIMLEAGYSAVSSRALAREAGVKPPLVHYYFRTMDDLFLELVRRFTSRRIERQVQALASATPFEEAWALGHDDSDRVLTMEFAALASRIAAVRDELARTGVTIREMQVELYRRAFDEHPLERQFGSPEATALLFDALSRTMGIEAHMGMSYGHAQALEVVRKWIEAFEGRAPASAASGAATERPG